MKYINTNLITLKAVLFLFFGGIGCLFPFLPLHMVAKGLTVDESKIISIVAPLIALIGPAVAGPLADRFAGSFGGTAKSTSGTYLRVLTAICLILAAIFYSCLAAVPTIRRSPPSVTFTCDEHGGLLLQQRCGSERECYNWDGETRGSVLVTNCRFTCSIRDQWTQEIAPLYADPDAEAYEEYEEDQYDENTVATTEDDGVANELPDDVAYNIIFADNDARKSALLSRHNGSVPEPLPHLCYATDSGRICEAYTEISRPIDLKLALQPVINDGSGQEANAGKVCKYPVAGQFNCRIPPSISANLTRLQNCTSAVVCKIVDPYNSTNSLLKVSQCGYNNISFYAYLIIRSLGDLFTAAAVALLSASVVIATRETSTGRGDVGKQFAAGALGLGIFAVIVGGAAEGHFLIALVSFCVLFLLAALILLFDKKMPLSPPEWWWHTRCGLLALPMSAVRRFGQETFAVCVVLFILGVFWSALDVYIPWHAVNLSGTALVIGLTVTVGSFVSLPFLILAEKIVDFWGHSNLLIVCFASYIIHFTCLTFIESPTPLVILEVLEVFTLHLMFVTAVLYMRHLVPRKYTACGQALPVITHFCLGRLFGSLFGGIGYTGRRGDFISVHYWFAVAAAVIGILYFLVFHFYLKPYCVAPIQRPPKPAPSVVQSMNGNGSYTPLRVYHNGSAKKGQFRY